LHLDRRGVFLDHRRGRCVRLVVSMRRLWQGFVAKKG
jgi:hypothetical protein